MWKVTIRQLNYILTSLLYICSLVITIYKSWSSFFEMLVMGLVVRGVRLDF